MEKNYQNSLKKSINVPKTDYGKRKKLETKYIVRRTVAVFLATAVIAIMGMGAKKVADNVERFSEIKSIQTQESIKANTKLVENDLFVVPDNGNWRNSYGKIEDLCEDDLYGFTIYLGKMEAEKVVRALGYTDFNNYLSMNGYFDSEGHPSMTVWVNYEEARLLEAKKGNIK